MTMKRSVMTAAVIASLAVASMATTASAEGGAPPLNSAALTAAVALRPGEAATGVLAEATAPGQVWRGTSGDTHTGLPVADDAYFRTGSISKTFEATVVLQLVAEHRVDLDRSIQQYLPGLLPGTFAPISVRELLDMTSGLPQIDAGAPTPTDDQLIADRYRYQSFEQIIQGTLRPADRAWPGPVFAPGTEQSYNSLNYRILGVLIERMTGHSFGYEVSARVLAPLHLTHTLVPAGDPVMPTPSLRGYLTDSQGDLVDVSDQGGDPSNMISTADDLTRFISALFQGRLLPPAQLAAMFTLPRDAAGNLLPYVGTDGNCVTGPDKGEACFGAGLMSSPLPDGTVLWGKTGQDLGYFSGVFATRDLQRIGVFSIGVTDAHGSAALTIANRLAAALISP